jgi:protein SHQ1
VVEIDGRDHASYDIESGFAEIRLPKGTRGEQFTNLDMLTRLLTPRKEEGEKNVLIEVIGSTEDAGRVDEGDWSTEQTLAPSEGEGSAVEATSDGILSEMMGRYSYGFCKKYRNQFENMQQEVFEVFDNPDPDATSPEHIREFRLEQESKAFDLDHYLYDTLGNPDLQELYAFRPRWEKEFQKASSIQSKSDHMAWEECANEVVQLMEKEREMLLQLPRREHLLTREEVNTSFLGLIDLLFTYAYNYRTNLGDNSCESGWNIVKISPTLSWMDAFTHEQEALVACYRRALVFPLYRTFELCQKCVMDVITILRLGPVSVLRCLLEIRHILAQTDAKYRLNYLYLDDFCIWIQSISSHNLVELSDRVDGAMQCVVMDDFEWPLDPAIFQEEEEEEGEGMQDE